MSCTPLFVVFDLFFKKTNIKKYDLHARDIIFLNFICVYLCSYSICINTEAQRDDSLD